MPVLKPGDEVRVPETWALEVHQDGKCIELATGTPQVITLVFEQMAAIFPAVTYGFRNRTWSLSVRKPGTEGEKSDA